MDGYGLTHYFDDFNKYNPCSVFYIQDQVLISKYFGKYCLMFWD